jgi:hypothetical protein
LGQFKLINFATQNKGLLIGVSVLFLVDLLSYRDRPLVFVGVGFGLLFGFGVWFGFWLRLGKAGKGLFRLVLSRISTIFLL